MNRILSAIADYIRECDKVLFALCCFASLYGGVAVLSAGSTRQFIMQMVGFVSGIIVAIIISKFDYKIYKKLWPLAVLLGLTPVILTFFIGYAPNGTDDKAWLLLPGNISFQPSEFLKIIFIITFSLHLSAVRDKIN